MKGASRAARHALTAIAAASIMVLSSGRAGASAKAGCPSDMTKVGETCVDRWEASLVEMLPDGTEIPWTPYAPPNGHRVRAISRAGVVPQAHMSFVESRAACFASGKRLCKADEWVRACKGPTQSKFPYGDDYVAGACVDYGRTAPNYTLYSREKAISYQGMNDPRLNQLPNTVAETGSANACTNEFGAFDMVGNLHEWADDAHFHGGYYLDVQKNGDGCEYVTKVHGPEYYDYSIGFRCCADVGTVDDDAEISSEPASLASAVRIDRLEEIARASLVRPATSRAMSSAIAALWK
jgi:hypothetical protein